MRILVEYELKTDCVCGLDLHDPVRVDLEHKFLTLVSETVGFRGAFFGDQWTVALKKGVI